MWLGRGRPVFQWRALITGTLLVALAVAIYRAALWSARWGGTFKLLAVVVLLLSLLSLWFGIRRLWKVVAHLGIRGLLILIVAGVLLMYLLIGASIGTGLGWGGWWAAGQIMTQQAGEHASNVFDELITVPDDLTVAFFGRSLVGSGEPLIGSNLADTSTSAELAATSAPSDSSPTPVSPSGDVKLAVGIVVRVVNTTGSGLRAHTEPGTDTPLTTLFRSGTRLTVVDGPRSAGGYVWWRVKGDTGEGWCAADFLTPVQ